MGFGAKITNIFSKEFVVVVEDPENKNRFDGVFGKTICLRDTPTNEKPDVKIEDR